MQYMHPPKNILCMLSNEIMSDPVMDSHSHTFDRKNIEAYLASNGFKCPVDGHELYS